MANIYKQFDAQDIVTIKKEITQGVFSNNLGTITSFFTGSQATEITPAGSALYYLNVYNANPSSDSNARVQFTVGYGHITGLGTPLVSVDNTSKRPTQAVYKQFANTLLPKGQDKFKFYNNTVADDYEADDIFVLNFSRARIKEKLGEGNFSITIGTLVLVDDSPSVANPTVGPGGLVYNLGIGTIGAGVNDYTASNNLGYGKIYPESGVIILNAAAINNTISAVTISSANSTSGSYDNNHFSLFDELNSVTARSSVNITSQNYFVRVRNTEFNFSNNPAYVTGSSNQIIDDLYNDPITYITTVGMYNNANELLAVAKVSKPIENGRDAETLVKVKVDF